MDMKTRGWHHPQHFESFSLISKKYLVYLEAYMTCRDLCNSSLTEANWQDDITGHWGRDQCKSLFWPSRIIIVTAHKTWHAVSRCSSFVWSVMVSHELLWTLCSWDLWLGHWNTTSHIIGHVQNIRGLYCVLWILCSHPGYFFTLSLFKCVWCSRVHSQSSEDHPLRLISGFRRTCITPITQESRRMVTEELAQEWETSTNYHEICLNNSAFFVSRQRMARKTALTQVN
jgi:hypothetical protein